MGSTTQATAQMQLLLRYGLPLLSTVFTAFQPAACQIVFAVGAAWGFLQANLLQSNKVRNFFDLQPLPPKGEAATPTGPYKGTITMHKSASGAYSSTGVDAAGAKKPGLFDGIMKGAKSSWSEAIEARKSKVQQNMEAARRTKAKQYEERRRKELGADKLKRR
jgi:hypothetical protein